MRRQNTWRASSSHACVTSGTITPTRPHTQPRTFIHKLVLSPTLITHSSSLLCGSPTTTTGPLNVVRSTMRGIDDDGDGDGDDTAGVATTSATDHDQQAVRIYGVDYAPSHVPTPLPSISMHPPTATPRTAPHHSLSCHAYSPAPHIYTSTYPYDVALSAVGGRM